MAGRAAATLSNQATAWAAAGASKKTIGDQLLIMVPNCFLILCARKASLLKKFHGGKKNKAIQAVDI